MWRRRLEQIKVLNLLLFPSPKNVCKYKEDLRNGIIRDRTSHLGDKTCCNFFEQIFIVISHAISIQLKIWTWLKG